MKVLHVIDHMGLGGVQASAKTFFEYQPLNSDIFLLSLRETRIHSRIHVNHPHVFQCPSASKYSIAPVRRIWDIVKRHRIDVLHCHLFKSQVLGVLIKQFLDSKIKVIFHEHGRIFGSETGSHVENLLFRQFLKSSKRNIDKYAAISAAVRSKLVKRGVHPDKIFLLNNFVDLNRFFGDNKLNDDVFTVGFAARLVERKGWKIFLESSIRLKSQDKIRLILGGDGPDKKKVIDFIEFHDLSNVRYLGYVDDMARFYRALNCFVTIPSWEPFGNTALEAQASGTPLIASRVPALSEIVDESNAVFVGSSDSEELAEKIVWLYKNAQVREKLSDEGVRNARKFSLENYLVNLKVLYNSLS